MRKGRHLLFLLLIIVLAGSVVFLYSRSPISGMGWEDALHYLMHIPVVQRIMDWVGLEEEEVLKGKKVYWCPMHPQVRRDRPGLCPICNMQLVEMEEEKEIKGDVLQFTDRQIQQTGIRTATVRMLDLLYEIDTTGRITVDERLLRTVSNWVRGRSRIEKLHVNFTGERVEKGQSLVSLYSPDLVTTQEEYLMILSKGGPWASSLLRAAEMRLKRWGVGKKDIQRLAEQRRPVDVITIHSPLSGTVIERLVTEGQYVEEGEPLLRLADLSRVWIYADVYEYELPFIRTGMPVEVLPRGIPGTTITGRIEFIDPVVHEESRTVKVRLEVDNPRGVFKPGMYARVRIRAPYKKTLAVPVSAVLLTGRRAVVIVSEGDGIMRPVEVKLGRRWLYAEDSGGEGEYPFLEDDERYHEVLSGLSEGEEVVVSGNFLIAAEASLQGMLRKMLPQEEKKGIVKPPPDLEATLIHILESYERIRRSLAMDRTGGIKETALEMVEDTMSALKMVDGELRDMLQGIRSAASAIADGPDDIKGIRLGFSSLSEAIILFVERYGIPEGVELHAFICPMADGYGGWLQPNRTVENPYMGQRMSTCGNILPLKGIGEDR